MTDIKPLAVVTGASSGIGLVQGLANKVLPDRLKAAAHRGMAEPGSGDRPGDADEEA